jgi:hypothetical protein
MSTTGTALRKPFPHKSHLYLAGFVLAACLIPMPFVATIFTSAIYILPFPMWLQSLLYSWRLMNWFTIITGFGATFVFWLLAALFARNFTSFESANPVSGSHLINHFSALCAGFATLPAPNDNGNSLPKESLHSYRIAYEQVKAYIEEIEGLLERKDMRWIAGTGYLQAWNLVHRAEEAMITLEPREEVIREAIYDQMCLIGSSITARAIALNKLELAVKNLSTSATQYLEHTGNGAVQNIVTSSSGQNIATLGAMPLVIVKNQQDTITGVMAITKDEKSLAPDETSIETAQEPGIPTTNATPKVASGEPGDVDGSATPIDKPAALVSGPSIVRSEKLATHIITETEARNALRDARRTINEFRDQLGEGLVNGRNLLIGTALITGLLTYVLICFAIIAGTTPTVITAATAFYLVGAIIGLFSRLYDESKVENVPDNYGLTLARITVTPVLAGIASVIGVLLTSMLSLTLLKSALPQNGGVTLPQLGLEDSFNLRLNPLGILIAAAFALTPNLLINTLKKKANDFTDQLRNTGPSDQATSNSQSKSAYKL